MRPITRYFFALLPLLVIETSHAEHFYKWVDDAGATHYTQTPPPLKKTTSSVVKVSTKLPADSEAATKNLNTLATDYSKATAESDQAAAKDRAVAAADAERRKGNAAACAQNQAVLAQLESGQRLHDKDANGDRTNLTEDQKAARIQQQKTQIQQNCPK